MKEIWEDVKRFEDRYKISNLGNIKSLPNKWYFSNGGYRESKGKILKKRIGNTGYYYVCIRDKNKCIKKVNIHRIVAEAFIKNSNNKPFVNHIDGNKLNNNVNNLEWVTMQENFDHAVKNNLTAKGEKCALHKLTEKQVIEIRKLYKEKSGWTYKKLSAAFNTCESNIYYILSGKYWNHI